MTRLFGVGTDETQTAQNEAQLVAFDRSQAIIEFGLDGIVLSANENFLVTLGYTLPEIRGQHHSMFVDPSYRSSPEYRLFWEKLGRGEYDAGQYKRIGTGGREVWIEASYNPILDPNGKPFKVVKYATDISQQKLVTANFEGQLAAINKAQAVIEFGMDGKILAANENFLLGCSTKSAASITACSSTRRPGPAPTTVCSGTSSGEGSSTPANTSASAKAAERSGSRPATTRSSIQTASRSRW